MKKLQFLVHATRKHCSDSHGICPQAAYLGGQMGRPLWRCRFFVQYLRYTDNWRLIRLDECREHEVK